MKSNFLFLGIGQAGGNVCQLLEQKGYNVLCLNTSQQDLDTLEVKHKYHINGGEGCNKDRTKSKELISNDYDNIAKLIDNFINVDNIFVVFSSGGGTGSGAGPTIAYLLTQDKPNVNVGVITILPAIFESYRAQSNAHFCFEELMSIEELGACFILDNKVNNDKLAINREFVKTFDTFMDIPEKDRSVFGNIDTAEIKTTLSAHNVAMLANIPNSNSTIATLLKELDNNIFAPIEKDSIVQYITLSLANKNVNLDSAMQELQKSFGMPLDTFTTYNLRGYTTACISGLSYPTTRLKQIADIVKEHTPQAQKILNNTSSLKTDVIDIFATKRAKAEKPKASRRDLLHRFMK